MMLAKSEFPAAIIAITKQDSVKLTPKITTAAGQMELWRGCNAVLGV